MSNSKLAGALMNSKTVAGIGLKRERLGNQREICVYNRKQHIQRFLTDHFFRTEQNSVHAFPIEVV